MGNIKSCCGMEESPIKLSRKKKNRENKNNNNQKKEKVGSELSENSDSKCSIISSARSISKESSSSIVRSFDDAEFYKVPQLFELDKFEVFGYSEEGLVDKCSQLWDEIQEVKNTIEELCIKLNHLNPDDKQMEKVLIFIGKGKVMHDKSKFQVCITQNLQSQVSEKENIPIDIESSASVLINNTVYPAIIEKRQSQTNDNNELRFIRHRKFLSVSTWHTLKGVESSCSDNEKAVRKSHAKDPLSRALAIKITPLSDPNKRDKESKIGKNSAINKSNFTMSSSNSLDAKITPIDYHSDEEQKVEKECVCLECTLPSRVYKGNKVSFKEMHTLYLHQDSKPIDKRIVLSFLEITPSELKIVGRDRTFYLSQFEEGKIYDVEVKFQKNFKSLEHASVNIKIQYIQDEENLIRKIIHLHEQKKTLLNEIKKIQEGVPAIKRKRNISQFGGWYDKNINARNDKIKSVISAEITSRDPSFLNDNEQNESQILQEIENNKNNKSCITYEENYCDNENKSIRITKENDQSTYNNDEFFNLFCVENEEEVNLSVFSKQRVRTSTMNQVDNYEF